MNRSISMCCLGVAFATTAVACGDNAEPPPPIVYTDPPAGGLLRLVKDKATTSKSIVLDLVVGDQPLTGYSVGFNLPIDRSKVKLAGFTPGKALDAGSAPAAAMAALPAVGPLKDNLVTAQSQKASGTGAVATDTVLAPGTVLYTLQLDLIPQVQIGVVFDGTAAGFTLPSGGLRNRAGTTVVTPSQVSIGRLEVTQE